MRSHDPAEPTALVEVPYEALTPRENDTANLLVPLCASFSHVAFSTYRLEPQYAVFGQSAGTAAAMAALSYGGVVQAVNVATLQSTLMAAGQVIKVGHAPPVPPPGPPSRQHENLALGYCTDLPAATIRLINSSAAAAAASGGSSSSGGSLLLENARGLCASAYGYKTASGTRVLCAACHVTDKSSNHQNQEWIMDPSHVICLHADNHDGQCAKSCLVATETEGVLLGACAARSAWKYDAGARRLTQPSSGLCLTSPEHQRGHGSDHSQVSTQLD